MGTRDSPGAVRGGPGSRHPFHCPSQRTGHLGDTGTAPASGISYLLRDLIRLRILSCRSACDIAEAVYQAIPTNIPSFTKEGSPTKRPYQNGFLHSNSPQGHQHGLLSSWPANTQERGELEQPPQRGGGIPITGSFQYEIGQHAR